jgi:PAS domain-containing protein
VKSKPRKKVSGGDKTDKKTSELKPKKLSTSSRSMSGRQRCDKVQAETHRPEGRSPNQFPVVGAADNKIDGAVPALLDIDDLKGSEREAKAARDYAEATVRTARDPLIVLRADLRVNTANEAFYKTFKTTPDQTEGRLIYDLGDRQWNIPKLRMLLEDILPRTVSSMTSRSHTSFRVSDAARCCSTPGGWNWTTVPRKWFSWPSKT